MKYLLAILPFFCCLALRAQQVDTNYLKALYDRCLDFDESRADSLTIYANIILKEAGRLHYDRGEVLASRLKGIAEDLKGDYEKAIVYYLQSLDAARKLQAPNYELAALTDLAYVYVNTKQPARAKEMYLQCTTLAESQKDLASVITAYSNLGAIYNQLKQADSALFFLTKGLDFAKSHSSKIDLSSFYSNMGNVYYEKKEYTKSLTFFQRIFQQHTRDSNFSGLWMDNLNMADVFIEMKNYDSGYAYAAQSLLLAQKLHARSKEADSYSMLAKLYSRKGDFKTAYDFQQKWYGIDTSLVNTGTNENIAALLENFTQSSGSRKINCCRQAWKKRVSATGPSPCWHLLHL